MNVSNRDIDKLYEMYNPNGIRSGDRVRVKITPHSYIARVVGLDLDIKNKKVFANLKLMDTTKSYPIRVDASDCHPMGALYPGHHSNG